MAKVFGSFFGIIVLLCIAGFVGAHCYLAEKQRAQNEVSSLIAHPVGEHAVVRSFEIIRDPGEGFALDVGDTITTKPGSHLTLDWFDGSLIYVKERSQIAIRALDPAAKVTRIAVVRGGIRLRAAKQAPHAVFNVLSKNAVVRVKGTDFTVDYESDRKQTAVDVYEGAVALFNKANPEAPVDIQAGEGAEALAKEIQKAKPDGTLDSNFFNELEGSPYKNFLPVLQDQVKNEPLDAISEEVSALLGDIQAKDDASTGAGGNAAKAALEEIRNDRKNLELDMVLEMANRSSFPEKIEEMNVSDDLKKDPWGNYYQIKKIDEKRILIFSMGPDGQTNTGDDIGF